MYVNIYAYIIYICISAMLELFSKMKKFLFAYLEEPYDLVLEFVPKFKTFFKI